MFKARTVEIHCSVVSCVGEKDMTVRVTVPEDYAQGKIQSLAVSQARVLAAVWEVKLEKIHVTVTVVKEERKVETHYDLSTSLFAQ